MDAKLSCEFLLHQLKSSNLNFMLQETPFSAYLTIRKSFVRNLNSNNLFPTLNESEETLRKKIEALEAENLCLKSENLDHKTELTKLEHIIIKLEDKVKTAEIQTIKHTQESKKVEKQFSKVTDFLGEKEKEIIKLEAISNNLNDDNVKIRENLRNVSNSLKVSEKEALKARNKCENLESTVAKLKAEKGTLQKNIKRLEKSKKPRTNSKPKQKLLEAFHPEANNNDSEETDTDHPITYNFPVSSNPFELLEDLEKKDCLPENYNFAKSEKYSDFAKNSEDAIEKEENDEPLGKKNKIMTPEQEIRVLKQIERIMMGTSEIT